MIYWKSAYFALPEGDPRIKQIDSRRIDYDFGKGQPEILSLLKAHAEKYAPLAKPDRNRLDF